MLLAGLGIGALASQLGSVTVSSVPDEQSGEVGGLQNTVTNLGASIGTALAGAVLISALTASFLTGIQEQSRRPRRASPPRRRWNWPEASRSSPTQDLRKALEEAGVPAAEADAIVEENDASPDQRTTRLACGLGDIRDTGVHFRQRNTNPSARRGAPDRRRRLSGEQLTRRNHMVPAAHPRTLWQTAPGTSAAASLQPVAVTQVVVSHTDHGRQGSPRFTDSQPRS